MLGRTLVAPAFTVGVLAEWLEQPLPSSKIRSPIIGIDVVILASMALSLQSRIPLLDLVHPGLHGLLLGSSIAARSISVPIVLNDRILRFDGFCVPIEEQKIGESGGVGLNR